MPDGTLITTARLQMTENLLLSRVSYKLIAIRQQLLNRIFPTRPYAVHGRTQESIYQMLQLQQPKIDGVFNLKAGTSVRARH